MFARLGEPGFEERAAGKKAGQLHRLLERGMQVPAGFVVPADMDLAQVSDAGELERIVDEALAANPGPVADYRSGKKQALGRIMGYIMRQSGGKANPKLVSQLLEKKLS